MYENTDELGGETEVEAALKGNAEDGVAAPSSNPWAAPLDIKDRFV